MSNQNQLLPILKEAQLQRNILVKNKLSTLNDMEFIFLGTGTSSQVPLMNCLAQTPITCKVCESAVEPQCTSVSSRATSKSSSVKGKSAKFSKNRRRNTSCLYRYQSRDGTIKNVLIDCGKSFYDSVLAWFTEYDLKNIDAVIITHGHADAVFGMDDLRMWTAGGNRKLQSSVDIYLNQESYDVVQRAFPYLCESAKATGSGEIASLNFHLFETNSTFTLFDELVVRSFPVEHGFYSNKEPYYANGFRIGSFCYVSDTSKIPPESLEVMKGCKYLVIDALRFEHHTSHFGYQESLDTCHQVLSPSGMGFFTGMGHADLHDDINAWIQKNLDKTKGISVQVAYDGQVVSIKEEEGDMSPHL